MFDAFPFIILGRVLAKVQQDAATGILVTPFWSTQLWFPHLLEIVIEHPRLLKPGKDLLQLPGKLDVVHPLHSKLALLVTIISGLPSNVQAYQQQLQPSCNWREGTKQQYDSTLRRWGEFCRTLKIHPITPHVNDVVEFLSLYDNGGWYGVIAAARRVFPSISQVFMSWPTIP